MDREKYIRDHSARPTPLGRRSIEKEGAGILLTERFRP